ncbi:MAG: protease [Lachnospiraceae bacterium]
MIKLEFPLNVNLDSPRPIFKAFINNVPFRCMLDTGADIPVFCKGDLLFEKSVGEMDGVSKYKNSKIGGFGKTDEIVMLWNMDTFSLSDKKCAIDYKGMKIAVMNKPSIPCDIILSASMFMKMKYTIDCSIKKHLLTIEANKNVYGVGYYDKKETIYIFSVNDN